MNGDRAKVFGATWLYRWQTSQGILGAIFSALTFTAVFSLLLGPMLGTSVAFAAILGIVLVIIFGFGFFLDRVAKFWAAQALVSTVRNPFLLDRLYEKEYLTMVTQHIPVVLALRELLADGGKHPELVDALDAALARLEQTALDKRWTIKPGEEVY